MTPASKKLRLAQPTLSAQLKQFELSLGQALFERKSRSLILTDKGKVVFDHADAIFKMGDKLTESSEAKPGKERVTLKVGVVSTLPKKNVHGLLRMPIVRSQVRVNLVSDALPTLLNRLMNHELDMVVSDRKAPSDVKGFYNHFLEKLPVVFVASPEFKSIRRKFPQSLAGQKIFLPSYDSMIRSDLDQFFKKHEVELSIKGEVNDDEFLRVIASSGQGVVAIVRSAVSDLIKSKELYVIGDNLGVHQDFYLITAERQTSHPIVQDILKKYKD